MCRLLSSLHKVVVVRIGLIWNVEGRGQGGNWFGNGDIGGWKD